MTDASLSTKTALIVGLGGLGCPAALALARAGVGKLLLCDDDSVDLTNLHRQILYTRNDVGRDKLEAAKESLLEEGAAEIELVHTRLLPENARSLVARADIVLEGADNFATKFLAADACYLEGIPVVHGAAVRFIGTAWSIGAEGNPCYRCLFEDILPDDEAPNCSGAGVFGPVVGIVGALMADLAIDSLQGETERRGRIYTLDGKRQTLRHSAVSARADCPLCGAGHARSRITGVHRALYTSPEPLEARLTTGRSASPTANA